MHLCERPCPRAPQPGAKLGGDLCDAWVHSCCWCRQQHIRTHICVSPFIPDKQAKSHSVKQGWPNGTCCVFKVFRVGKENNYWLKVHFLMIALMIPRDNVTTNLTSGRQGWDSAPLPSLHQGCVAKGWRQGRHSLSGAVSAGAHLGPTWSKVLSSPHECQL